MEKPAEESGKNPSSGERIADLVSKVAVDYLQLMVEGAKVYQNEMDKSKEMPFLLRNVKGVARANARFLDGVAARMQLISEVMRHNPPKWYTNDSIDYDKLANMIADKLKAPKDSE